MASAVGNRAMPGVDHPFSVEVSASPFDDIVAVSDFLLDSVRYQSVRGLVPPGSKIIVPWNHGWTGVRSHSISVLQQLLFMNSNKSGGSVGAVRSQGNWVPTASMGVDQPWHGAGPRRGDLLNYLPSLEWRYQYYSGLQKYAPTLPIVPATRSGENIPVAQLNLQYPGIFKGMIWMSPVHPSVGTVEGLRGYHHFNVTTENQLYPDAFRWASGFMQEMRDRPESWVNSEHPFGNPPIPTLILSGSEDVESSPATKAMWREYARRFPERVFLVEIPGAGHNVFEIVSVADKERSIQAWSYVYWFLNQHILGNEAKLPPYRFLYEPAGRI